MVTTNKTGIVEFINLLVLHGLKEVVCSPGSRNAPLIIAIDNHPELTSRVIHDERSAAFYALGMALASGKPVAVVCTSGSAMLNYYPAVAEAFYQCVPLVVISADRPSEWINHGDGQTIVQQGVYDNHIRFQGEIPEFINNENDRGKIQLDVEKGMLLGSGNWKGPIHFNVPISEPMYDTVELQIDEESDVEVETEGQEKYQINDEELKVWKESKNIMIVCGQMKSNHAVLSALSEIAKSSHVAVLVESTSNLVDKNFVHCIDRTLSGIKEDELNEFRPDLLITIGGAIISKRIKRFLRESEIKNHWKIGFEFPEMDTYRALSNSIRIDTGDFLKSLLDIEVLIDSNFGNKWKQRDLLTQDKLQPFIVNSEYSDLSVFNLILDYLPENSILHMANSSVVRYCQLFNPLASVTYYSNRGTSGIDGCTSTACGVSLLTPEKLNILITGDVSFFYDSNALWNNEQLGNLKIILINNDGGGIFKIIEGPENVSQTEKFFEAKHGFSAEHICESFGVKYSKSNDLKSLEQCLQTFFELGDGNRPELLEVFTPSDKNHLVLREFFNSAIPS